MKKVLTEDLRPEIGSHVKDGCEEIVKLLHSCWKKDPAERPSCEDIKLILQNIDK